MVPFRFFNYGQQHFDIDKDERKDLICTTTILRTTSSTTNEGGNEFSVGAGHLQKEKTQHDNAIASFCYLVF